MCPRARDFVGRDCVSNCVLPAVFLELASGGVIFNFPVDQLILLSLHRVITFELNEIL